MRKALFLSVLLLFGLKYSAQEDFDSIPASADRVYIFEINTEIGPPAWRTTKKAFEGARDWNADAVIMRLNTYGGQVDMADSIRTHILRSKIPVYVLIENNAASAGALISIACNKIFMQPGSTIGAATVVDQSGKPVPDKYQSYMRSKMRSTAEQRNRDPDIAEAMVDPDKEVEGISEKGKVLTFTTSDAVKHGFCEAELNTVQEVLAYLQIPDAKTKTYTPERVDKIINWLINPAISGVLILIIMGGIYFELQTPGLGFPIAASVAAAILFFAPYYLEGMAENWEILLFIAGVALLAVEVFALPGFGVAGIAGVVLLTTGLVLSMVENEGLDFSGVDVSNFSQSLLTVLIALLGSMVVALLVGAKMFNSGALKKLVLSTSQLKEDGFVSNPSVNKTLHNKTGVATTDLRPGGKVKIDNEYYDAASIEGYIPSGTQVTVIKTDSFQVKVRKTNDDE